MASLTVSSVRRLSAGLRRARHARRRSSATGTLGGHGQHENDGIVVTAATPVHVKVGDLVAKLYFRYGTMDSAKTLNLLAVAHNYRKQGKRVALLKPRVDDRFGQRDIASRSGLRAEADLLVDADTVLDPERFEGLDCVLVDEAQFLAPALVEQLRMLTLTTNVPVICYGLRTDFRTRSFPGAQRLMELADTIEEVKVTCGYCDRKAVFNLRTAGGEAVLEGEQVALGNEEYAPVCWRHYVERATPEGLKRMGFSLPGR